MSHSFTQSRFRYLNCTSKLLQITLDPKFVCAHTKVEAIILNVYEAHTLNVLHSDLERLHILTDTSNHKEIKIFPVLVRCFVYKTGVNIKILELKSLPGKISDIVSDYLSDCLTANDLI
jgi:hypothetical protein